MDTVTEADMAIAMAVSDLFVNFFYIIFVKKIVIVVVWWYWYNPS